MFDDIIVGSGLVAVAVACGLPDERRILVIGGPAAGRSVYYDPAEATPCAHVGHGGLGSYWHGVISTGGRLTFDHSSSSEFGRLLRRFYPNTEVGERLGKPWLFVPWRPIRPKVEWCRLKAERSDRLTIVHDVVSRFSQAGRQITVHAGSSSYRAKRIWICAGPLHSPGLLDRSLDAPTSRRLVSDHVFCYLGQIDRSRIQSSRRRVKRTRDGVWFEARHDDEGRALYTLRPGRFAFRRLDHGFERRRIFGLPGGGAASKLLRGPSLGLLAEALYNRAGLFPNARVQNVYAYVTVPDAYRLDPDDHKLHARHDRIQACVNAVRAAPAWKDLRPSRRPELFMPAVHLHHSVDVEALARMGVNHSSNVQVVDASVYPTVGPDHHTFKLMVTAFTRARALGQRE